jgi:phage-related protein
LTLTGRLVLILTGSHYSNRPIAAVQEIRDDLVEFEHQVEEDTMAAIKRVNATGTDKKREQELMKLVLAATA